MPYIRTNIPQSVMSFGAHNPIYGQTRNPLDIHRSPGGSSSGEAVAVACKVSYVGLGTDFGNAIIYIHDYYTSYCSLNCMFKLLAGLKQVVYAV